MVENTKPKNDVLICCKACNTEKIINKFPKGRKKCKQCYNDDRKLKFIDNPELKKHVNQLSKKRFDTCPEKRDLMNLKRRQKYAEDEEYKKRLIKNSIETKQKKILLKHQLNQQEQERIGLDNKFCKYCKEIKPKINFRHNRLKCKDCERDEPVEKLKRYIRTYIYNCLRNKNKIKNKHTIDYLDCNATDYIKYLTNYNIDYKLENHGNDWHIDHVIPVSKFDLNDENQKYLAFNWRNTMPLSAYENMSKCNRICQQQLTNHIEKIKKYHLDNNIKMPNEFLELFAKHLDVREHP